MYARAEDNFHSCFNSVVSWKYHRLDAGSIVADLTSEKRYAVVVGKVARKDLSVMNLKLTNTGTRMGISPWKTMSLRREVG